MEKIDKEEKTPKYQIVDLPEEYYFDNEPDTQEGKIIHYKKRLFDKDRKEADKFLLEAKVGRYSYILNFGEAVLWSSKERKVYGISFKTKEYEFATTDLDEEEKRELSEIIPEFIREVQEYLNGEIDEILVSPSGAPYSTKEIDECIDSLILITENKYTKEQLLDEFNGFRIFDLYKELTGKDFLPVHYNADSRAKGRSRLFKMLAKKYLPEWQVNEDEYNPNSIDFTLIRRNANK